MNDHLELAAAVGADGLLGYLRSRDAQLFRTFSRKVLGYALGRTISAADTTLINEMVSVGPTGSFTDLAVMVATSRQFLNHQGPGADGAEPEPEAPTAAGTSVASRLMPPEAGAR